MSRVKVFNIIRKVYDNPYSILLAYVLNKPIRVKVSGLELTFPKERTAYVYHLTKLLLADWKIRYADDKYIVVQKDNIIIKTRYTKGFDLWHIIEIFEDKEYGDNFDGIVLDIGCSNGDSSIYFAKHGTKKVIALEPDLESYELAIENINLNNLNEKVTILNKGLGSRVGKSKFMISTSSPNANALEPTRSVKDLGIKFDRQIDIDVIDLDYLLRFIDNEDIMLLKMDCEGCEYEVFNSVDKRILDKIRNIILEYHDYPKNLPSLLKEHGFKVEYEDKPLGILKAYKDT